MTAPVVFNHVPKSAGTALTTALIESLGARRIRGGMDRSVFGAFDDFDALDRTARRMVVVHPDELPERADLVAGHFAPSTTRARYPGANDLTVLREARTRLLSQWLFARAHQDRDLRHWGGYGEMVRMARGSFASYLDEPAAAPHADNLTIRFLLWPHEAIPVDGFIDHRHDRELLERAVEVLESFSHVGVMESPAFIRGLETWLGAPFELTSSNEMPWPPAELRPDLEIELATTPQGLLQDRTRLDAALWAYVLHRDFPGVDVDALADTTFRTAVARYVRRLAEPAPSRRPLPTRIAYKVAHRMRQWRVTHS